MMLAGLLICLRSNAAQASTPEPLDADFLDYLLACEGKDDNWTVVADEKLRKQAAKDAAKEKTPPTDKDKHQEAKP
jgi:hypothetical protein